MKTLKDYAIEQETLDEQHAAMRMNPGQVIVYWDHGKEYRAPISAGNSDQVEVFYEAGVCYILSINQRYGYVGLEAFAEGQPVGESIFLQDDSAIRDVLGTKGLDLTPKTIAMRLANHLY